MATLMAHLDSVPFVVRACGPADVVALAALQGACGRGAQRQQLSEQALQEVLAPSRPKGRDMPLVWVAQVGTCRQMVPK